MSAAQVHSDVLSLFDEAWPRLLSRLEGLTSDEYLWEPVASCWTVRETAEGVRADWADPDPDPAPVTTIAWRLWHVAVDCLDSYSARVFGRRGTEFVEQAFTLDVGEALAATDAAGAAFRAGLGERAAGDALRPARSDMGSVPRLHVPRAHAARARRGHPPQRRDRARSAISTEHAPSPDGRSPSRRAPR